MPKLTKRVIDALPAKPLREVFAWDSELRGFGVRVQPSGVATYLVKYRNAEGRQRKLALGRVSTLTPEEARKLARERLTEVANGADPSAARHQLRNAMTVAELCDLYLQEAKGRVKASTLAMDRSRIERHVKPLIGRRTVPSLTTDDIEQLQADIAAGKTAVVPKERRRGGITTGGKGVASRTVGMLGTILELARRKKLIKENPARGVERLPEGRQTRFLTLAELARLGEAMRKAEAEGANATGLAAVRFLLLSGCRRMEALALPLAWLDAEASCIRFQDAKGIRAREMGSRVELRPLGAAAFAVVRDLARPKGCPWAFPAARGDGHFVGLPNLLDRLCTAAQLEGVTVHVLRHTFAATAAGMGYSELTIAGLLGHRVPGVTARYAHVPDAALVAAAEAVSGRIAAALEGGAEVVPLRPAKLRSGG
ncbi:MAG: integrase arm-type DNA-binding domain-containing protein [Acetobacteraceae bacterium]|nr:integrase arm-type DNA-binding domain-containing protein [Acetobacteraceae bacterium]